MKIGKKNKIIETELNKKRGKRLQECRLIKGLTQQGLADIAGYAHPNSISQLETGEREITWDKAVILSDSLGVQAEYLMCTSDLKKAIPRYSYINNDIFNTVDFLFIQSLILKGHDIKFIGVTELPEENELCISNINNFVKFSLKSPDSCIVNLDSGQEKEFIIHSVMINGSKISIGMLLFVINRIYDYIDFTLDNIKSFFSDFDLCSATDSMVQNAITERNDGGYELEAAINEVKKEIGEEAYASLISEMKKKQ